MPLLLDTHVLLWALMEPSRLPLPFRAKLEDPAEVILFSAASLWEIAIKADLGRFDFQIAPGEVLSAALETGFTELPVRSAAALRVGDLPPHHRDPFDGLLIAQAMCERLRLYTADAALAPYSDLVVFI